MVNLLRIGIFLAASALAAASEELPYAILPATEYDFGEVRLGQAVSHDFLVKNLGKGVLKVIRAELSNPAMNIRTRPIEPGSEEQIGLELKTAGMAGVVDAQAIVFFNDPVLPKVVLTLRGRVRPPLEVRPFGTVFLAAFKDELVERPLTVVNNEEKPNAVKQVRSEGSHFVASLKIVEPGRVYAVNVKVAPGAPVGRYEETLVIEMSSPPGRTLRVPVHLFVKPDLYATPDSVDFGEISLEQIRLSPAILDLLNQTVLVTSRRSQFSIVSTACDLPDVTVRMTPASGPSGTFRVDLSLNPDRLKRGLFGGTLTVKTNDPELGEVRIPIRGKVIQA